MTSWATRLANSLLAEAVLGKGAGKGTGKGELLEAAAAAPAGRMPRAVPAGAMAGEIMADEIPAAR